TFVDQPTAFDFTPGFSSMGGPFSAPPDVGGYNLTSIRPEANMAAVPKDEYQAPLVSSWNAGNGRVLCFAGEADGKYSGSLASWNQAGEFYATLARWTAGKHQPLPDDQLLTEEVRDGVCFVQLHLDPERKADPFSALPKLKILRGTAGLPPIKQTVSLDWKNADLLEASIPMSGRETVLSTVEVPGEQAVTLPPVCLPYSPEFAPEQPGRGAAALTQIASTSGGKERIEIPSTWAELQVKPRYIEIVPWLLVAAVVLFLTEVFERRTGWISRLFNRQQPAVAKVASETEDEPATREPEPAVKRLVRKRKQKTAAPTTAPAATARQDSKPEKPSAPAAPVQPTSTDSNLDALRKARERADRRTGRNK